MCDPCSFFFHVTYVVTRKAFLTTKYVALKLQGSLHYTIVVQNMTEVVQYNNVKVCVCVFFFFQCALANLGRVVICI